LDFIAKSIVESAVTNFFTPASQKAPEKLSWRVVEGTLLIGRYISSDKTAKIGPQKRRNSSEVTPAKKCIAAFDFDSTLIKTISKTQHARDANDWQWWHGSVPGRLKELHESGYILVILSNQKGIALKPVVNGPKFTKNDRYTQFKQKAAAVFNSVNLPISVYAATERDRFRKPATGMWDELLKDHTLKEGDVDLGASFFVGDAGGRKGDFACSDRNFAANVGIVYKSPEEFFLSEEPREFSREFDPSEYLLDTRNGTASAFKNPSGIEIVLFVGIPGAGKSTFFQKYLKPIGYGRINQDIMKSVSSRLARYLNALLTFRSERDVFR
jgi:bifunctional polynucleotide phosphatase/kinase